MPFKPESSQRSAKVQSTSIHLPRLNSSGFTLVELTIVMAIIGVLAAIALPRFADTKERVLVTSMQADLRNLVTAEENYFIDYGTYTDVPGLGAGFRASPGVTVTVANASPTGWEAVSVHTGTVKTCIIYVGYTAPPGSNEGQPDCS